MLKESRHENFIHRARRTAPPTHARVPEPPEPCHRQERRRLPGRDGKRAPARVQGSSRREVQREALPREDHLSAISPPFSQRQEPLPSPRTRPCPCGILRPWKGQDPPFLGPGGMHARQANREGMRLLVHGNCLGINKENPSRRDGRANSRGKWRGRLSRGAGGTLACGRDPLQLPFAPGRPPRPWLPDPLQGLPRLPRSDRRGLRRLPHLPWRGNHEERGGNPPPSPGHLPEEGACRGAEGSAPAACRAPENRNPAAESRKVH